MPSEKENRALWLSPYLALQAKQDIRLRTVLVAAAADAEKEVIALTKKQTFSSGVRIAQIRLLMDVLQPVLKELFGDVIPVVGNTQKDAAVLAVDKFSKADESYLRAAFSQSGEYAAFLSGQKQSARIGIQSAIRSITESDYDLSSTVYTTRALANRWLKNYVTGLVLRGESAQTIARSVKRHIRPDTPGGVSYAALRLGRTELNNAFHATAVDLAKDRPWVTGMDWHLSAVHTHNPNKAEICEQYAQKKWTVENVPNKPHPQCRCYVTPRLISKAEFNKNLTNGRYRSWIDAAA